jgi:hypothetical protein
MRGTRRKHLWKTYVDLAVGLYASFRSFKRAYKREMRRA